MGSTVVCGPRQSGDPYTPPPPRLFFVPEFLSCNRCLDIDVDDHFALLSSRLSTSFDVTLHLYFLSPFQLYIYFETKWIKGDSFFVCFDFLYRYFSNVSRGNGLFHVTFSQLFEWKKVGKYLSILSGSSLAVCFSL